MTTWRYQPIYTIVDENTDERWYSIIEVYFDENGRLDSWTMTQEVAPTGDTNEDLIEDLEMMLRDARKWKPVLYTDITNDTIFEEIEGESDKSQ